MFCVFGMIPDLFSWSVRRPCLQPLGLLCGAISVSAWSQLMVPAEVLVSEGDSPTTGGVVLAVYNPTSNSVRCSNVAVKVELDENQYGVVRMNSGCHVGTIIVEKQTVPDGAPEDFEFRGASLGGGWQAMAIRFSIITLRRAFMP